MTRYILTILFVWAGLAANAQFAPQAGVPGSTAIHKSDNAFTGWAKDCSVTRGWIDIADKLQGYVSLGIDNNATGMADNNGIVSLGDSGVAILTFESPIYNGSGADFAVFENGFPNPADPEEAFMELAFVEVSSDGINYTRFPAVSHTALTTQVPASGVYMVGRNVNNLAGKYTAGYGTPFDLEELAGTAGLDINHITHVRLVDVIGDVNVHTSKDKDGNIINDPYPTAFNGGGFDLDAVGVIHMTGKFPAAIYDAEKTIATVYPNPATDKITISLSPSVIEEMTATLTDMTGKVLQQLYIRQPATIQLAAYNKGIYYLVLQNAQGNKWVEKISKL